MQAAQVRLGDNLDAFKNRVVLAGVTPDGEDHFGRFVVLLEPVRAGALGMACVSGVCPARVYVDDEELRFTEAQGSLATVATPTEMRDFIEEYVGPMVLKSDGEIDRKPTAPAEAEAVVKRLLAGARFLINSRPDGQVILPFIWGSDGVCDVA